jgi:hypothetical protein
VQAANKSREDSVAETMGKNTAVKINGKEIK